MTDTASWCSTCHAPVIWARHPTTWKPAPFDAEPSELGLWELRRADPGIIVAVYVGNSRPLKLEVGGDALEGFYTPHFATCPDAEVHRRG